MKKITALVLCLIMICSCAFVQAFADDAAEAEQTESAAEAEVETVTETEVEAETAAETEVEAVTETETAAEAEAESATVIISEAPICLAYADNGAALEVLDNSGDYVKVKTADGVEGYADARCLIVFKVSGAAKVSAERAEIFAEILKQGDTVEIIERGDDVTKVKANDTEGEIETRFLRFDDEEEYQSKTVYTAPDTKLYDNPYLRGSATWLKKNTELTVLADLGDVYYVKGDSVEGYISKDSGLDSEVDYTLVPNPYVIEASDTGKKSESLDDYEKGSADYWRLLGNDTAAKQLAISEGYYANMDGDPGPLAGKHPEN